MQKEASKHKSGRGAQLNPYNRFASQQYETEDSYLEYLRLNGEDVMIPQKTGQ